MHHYIRPYGQILNRYADLLNPFCIIYFYSLFRLTDYRVIGLNFKKQQILCIFWLLGIVYMIILQIACLCTKFFNWLLLYTRYMHQIYLLFIVEYIFYYYNISDKTSNEHGSSTSNGNGQVSNRSVGKLLFVCIFIAIDSKYMNAIVYYNLFSQVCWFLQVSLVHIVHV